MRVSLRHVGRGVAKQPLYYVERHALVHQEAGERVAKVMQADVCQSVAAVSDAVPGIEQAAEAGREDWIAGTRSPGGERR